MMSSKNILFYITFIAVVIATITHAEDNCTLGHSAGTQLSIDSRRNDSGHWVSQVELIHSDGGERKGDPWTVDVHYRTTSCGDDSPGEVVIGATLISPKVVSDDASENRTKRIIGQHLGDIGALHRFDRTIKFKFSNSTATWYDARDDCYHFHCSLVQSEIQSRTTLMHIREFIRSSGKIHMGFQQNNYRPYHFEDLAGNSLTAQEIGSSWAPGQPPSKNTGSVPTCVTYDARYLSTGSCADRLHFMCICRIRDDDSEEYVE